MIKEINAINKLYIKFLKHYNTVFIVAITGDEYKESIGGCRFTEYSNVYDSINDAIKLSQGMYLKNKIFKLPFNGAKGVINSPANCKREIILHEYGKFLAELSGQYITGLDVGVTDKDMDIVRKETRYVCDDCSEATAIGYLVAVKEIARYRLNKKTLKGVTFGIQGVGKTGALIASLLQKEGAKLIISDTNHLAIENVLKKVNAEVILPEKIYDVSVDIFCPCAFSPIDRTIAKRIDTKVIAGVANNQLEESVIDVLNERDIFFVPEPLINSGGVIYASLKYLGVEEKLIIEKINSIAKIIREFFKKIESEKSLNINKSLHFFLESD